MIFLDLLKSVNKQEVLEYLGKNEGEKFVPNFEKMIDTLLTTIPTPYDLKLYLVSQKYYTDGDEYISVLGYSEKDNESYALEFMKWSEWLGCEVVEKSVNHFGPVPFVAECLSEMSFISFDEDKIQAELDNLNEISERLKNGEEKTYTMEEVLEHLNKELGTDFVVHERTVEEEKEESEKMKEIIAYNEQQKKEMLE